MCNKSPTPNYKLAQPEWFGTALEVKIEVTGLSPMCTWRFHRDDNYYFLGSYFWWVQFSFELSPRCQFLQFLLLSPWDQQKTKQRQP